MLLFFQVFACFAFQGLDARHVMWLQMHRCRAGRNSRGLRMRAHLQKSKITEKTINNNSAETIGWLGVQKTTKTKKQVLRETWGATFGLDLWFLRFFWFSHWGMFWNLQNISLFCLYPSLSEKDEILSKDSILFQVKGNLLFEPQPFLKETTLEIRSLLLNFNADRFLTRNLTLH